MHNKRKTPPHDRAFVGFFSGAMGLDLGLEAAGLEPLAANEFDPIICIGGHYAVDVPVLQDR